MSAEIAGRRKGENGNMRSCPEGYNTVLYATVILMFTSGDRLDAIAEETHNDRETIEEMIRAYVRMYEAQRMGEEEWLERS